ncbi:cytochrome P450 6g1-like isoform X2 [Episyrphus balteatus]|nr:cytochrome P450 6g1-like isoform X2 [Episyrphus balteatus]XP_055853967.1 cytochrome P450 6g1-like isoform X2 [Episyrphus balteatus]XP_055853968.1 cytochrome P450 6g1-like isoform X2 [Episyrphus balteatus]
MALSEWLLILSGVLTILYFWISHHFSYWRRKNVPYIDPSYIFGNLKDMVLMKSCAADHMITLYSHKKAQNEPVVGFYIFNKPALLIRDLDLIKSVLIKDFNKFSDRFTTCDPHSDALGSFNLFFIKNPYWKEMRSKLSPVFTSGKIKQMFPLVEEIGVELDKYLCNLALDSNTNVTEVKDICGLYTTDVIASVAFGVQANSLKNPNAEFRRNGKALFKFTPWRAFEFTVIFFLPQFVKIFGCKMFSKEAAQFLRGTINYIMAERTKSGLIRNDLIDTLVAFKKAAEADKDKQHIAQNTDMLVAQAAVFFTAGFETTSSSMSFGLYELSKKPELQKRLRQEIKDALVKCNGKINYDMILEMEYLNMVLQEVLRLYPPLPFLDRQCTLAEGEKEYSMKPLSDFGIPNGMPVYIPVYAIQRDPKFFPNPDEFDPERFSAANKANFPQLAYMPFGTGPHNCIGERFGILQAKLGLINFLRNHSVTTCEKTHKKMILDPNALIIQSKGGIYLKIVRDPLLA